MTAALTLNNINKTYGTIKALNDVNLTIQEGDFVGLLGVNGAGKTTLISSISGVTSFSGDVFIMKHNLRNEPIAAKRNLGVVPQEIAFDPFLTVYRTLKFQAGMYGVRDDAAHKSWLTEIIERLHLKDKIDAPTRSLSGGMKRRLMVAQALLHKPPVLILDEPTAGVDVQLRRNLWDFITELHQKGHTILLTTHYLEEVEHLCNKIVLIHNGKLVKQCTATEFINQSNSIPTILELELTDAAITLPQDLAANLAAITLKRNGKLLQLKLNNSDDLLTILTQFRGAHIKIDNININRPDLEAVFIDYLLK